MQIQLEGKEDSKIICDIGTIELIPNEAKYRKNILDQRESMYYNSSHAFDLDFENGGN